MKSKKFELDASSWNLSMNTCVDVKWSIYIIFITLRYMCIYIYCTAIICIRNALAYTVYIYIYIHMFFQRHIHLRSTFWCQKALPHLEIQLLQGQVVGRNFRHLCVSARQWSCLIKTSTGGATVTATGAIWQQISTGYKNSWPHVGIYWVKISSHWNDACIAFQ